MAMAPDFGIIGGVGVCKVLHAERYSKCLLVGVLGLEGLDLRLDASPPLLERALGSLELFGLRSPVFRLLGRLEGRVFPDSCVRVCVDLLNIFRADTVRKVGRELLLEAIPLSIPA